MMTNRMITYLYKLQHKQQRWPWFRSCYFGLKRVSPLLLIGILIQCLTLSFFQPHGFFYEIYHLDKIQWVSEANGITHLLSCVFFDVALLLLCVLVAWYRGYLFNKKEAVPGAVVALILLFFINFHVRRTLGDGAGQVNLSGNIPFIEMLVIGLIGAYFYHITKKYLHLKSVWSFSAATIVLGSLIKGVERLLSMNFFSSLSAPVFAGISSLLNDDQHQILGIILREIGRNLFVWLGFISPDQILVAHTDNDLTRANLSAALIKDNLEGLPHPLNIYSLSDSFAVLGGYGQILALLLLFLLFSRYRTHRINAWKNLFPVFLNVNIGFLAEVPLFFNIVLIIPFIFVPVISILLGALAIKIGLISPSVYQVPLNTPTVLNAFMGTNGHWNSLIFTLTILLISMLMYYPFFKALEMPAFSLTKTREEQR
ncbi:PTS sugar transporter subunit IIC [Liquorilactobacillus uvarum]|uniref:PTS sugar transporter subunit IIC n=1 Tax=Liquorilactobacillus uvarum TaxID=303240 RepID=UPI00070AE85C|nr:PTS sugar transporter subunit IIC [Liquorilactobacillus uvarum]